MQRDWTTATDDADGELPCPWCGSKQGDTFEISEGTDECGVCGGEREIEREVVATVYAFRGEKPPTLPIELARTVEASALTRYLEARGWTLESGAGGLPDWYAWRPSTTDARGAKIGFMVGKNPDVLDLGRLVFALDRIAAHEGRDRNAVLVDIANDKREGHDAAR